MRKWLDNPKEIAFEVRDRVAYITLNRPEKRNAITVEMLEELRGAMLEADDLTAVRCIVLQGAGQDFSAGPSIGGDGSPPRSEERRAGPEDGSTGRCPGLPA